MMTREAITNASSYIALRWGSWGTLNWGSSCPRGIQDELLGPTWILPPPPPLPPSPEHNVAPVVVQSTNRAPSIEVPTYQNSIKKVPEFR